MADRDRKLSSSLKIYETLPDQTIAVLRTKVDLAAAQRDAGDLDAAQQGLTQAIGDLEESSQEPALLKARARYHLAVCERKLDHPADAEGWAVESIQHYNRLNTPEDATVQSLRQQSVELYRELLKLRNLTDQDIDEKLQALEPAPR